MKQTEFQRKVVSLVDDAIEYGLVEDNIEEVLQQEAQNIRENRRVYDVFVYECPNPNCEESNTQLIDRIGLQCDICEQPLTLFESIDKGHSELMKFHCEDHGTVRVHEFLSSDTTCSIHNDSMELIESYTTEKGLGN